VNFTPHEISLERLKLQTSSFVHGLATRTSSSANVQLTNCPLSGRGHGGVMHSEISHFLKYLSNGWSYSR